MILRTPLIPTSIAVELPVTSKPKHRRTRAFFAITDEKDGHGAWLNYAIKVGKNIIRKQKGQQQTMDMEWA